MCANIWSYNDLQHRPWRNIYPQLFWDNWRDCEDKRHTWKNSKFHVNYAHCNHAKSYSLFRNYTPKCLIPSSHLPFWLEGCVLTALFLFAPTDDDDDDDAFLVIFFSLVLRNWTFILGGSVKHVFSSRGAPLRIS